MAKRFTKKTSLTEVLKYPGARDILAEQNLPCLSCPFAKFEMENLTLEEICEKYNIDLKKLLKELKKI